MKVYGYREIAGENVLSEIYDIKEATYTGKDMGERQVVATIKSHRVEDFQIGDYIQVQLPNLYIGHGETIDEKFYIYTQPTIKKSARSGSVGDAFEHTVTFYPAQYELGTTMMRDILQRQSAQELTGSNIIYTGYDGFVFYGGAAELMRRIKAVLDARFGSDVWSVNVAEAVDEDKNTSLEKFQFEFSGNTVWDALVKLHDEGGVNTDFYVIDRTIYVGYKRPYFMSAADSGTETTDDIFQFEYGKTSHLPYSHKSGNLYSITKSIGTKSPITRLYAYGSTRNLNRFYCSDRVRSGRYINKLMLPSFSNDGDTDWIDSADGIKKYGIREGVKEFGEIYPSLRYISYGDLRQIKYVIKIMGSGAEYTKEQIEDSLISGSWAYPVARVQCYKVMENPYNPMLNMLVEAYPPERIAVFVHAIGKTIKCTLGTSLEDQIALDGTWSNGNARVPAKSLRGNDYIPGSCFCVHDDGYYDADGTLGTHTQDRDHVHYNWWENIEEMPTDTALHREYKREVELRQINYTDDSWITDVFAFEKYAFELGETPHFRRDGYSAYCYAHVTNKYHESNSDAIFVNDVIEVGAVTIPDTDANQQSGRQATFDVYLRDVGFKINEATPFGNMQFVVAQDFKLNFYDGNLGGLDFAVAKFGGVYAAYNPDGSLNENFMKAADDATQAQRAIENGAYWLLKCKRNEDNEYTPLPNTIVNANTGDHVVFLDIYMPDVYIRAAENQLLKEAQKYLNDNDNGDLSYSLEFDAVRLAQVQAYQKQLREGITMRVVDEDLQIYTDNEELQLLNSANGIIAITEMEKSTESVETALKLQTIADRRYYIGANDGEKVVEDFNYAAKSKSNHWQHNIVAETINGNSDTNKPNKLYTFSINSDNTSLDIILQINFISDGGINITEITETRNIVHINLCDSKTNEVVREDLFSREFPRTYNIGYAKPTETEFTADIKYLIEKAGDYYLDFQVEDAYYRHGLQSPYYSSVGLWYGFSGTISYVPVLYGGNIGSLHPVSGDDTTKTSEFIAEIPVNAIGLTQLADAKPIYTLECDKKGWNRPDDIHLEVPYHSEIIEQVSGKYRVLISLHHLIRLADYNHININFYVKYPVIHTDVKSGAGLLIPCMSKDMYAFRGAKYYEIVADIMKGYLYEDTDEQRQAFFLSQDTEGTSRYIPNYEIELLEDGIAFQRIKISFYLPEHFNEVAEYYPTVTYVSDAIAEYAKLILYSITERNTDQYGDVIKYADLTIDELTIKLTDTTNEYSIGTTSGVSLASGLSGKREVRATVKEKQRASAWVTLMDEVKQNAMHVERTERTKEDLERQARRKFRELDSLKENIFDPDGSICQIFLQTMLLQVGADSMNYILDKTRIAYEQMSNISFAKDANEIWSISFSATDVLRHRAYIDNGYDGRWNVATLSAPVVLDDDKVYYVAIKAVRNSNEAQWVVDTIQHSVSEEDGYWYFNYGIISSVNSRGERFFTETRGNVYVYGDNIFAGRIVTMDGDSYLDLDGNEFKLGDTLHYVNGVLTIKGSAIGKIGGQNLFRGVWADWGVETPGHTPSNKSLLRSDDLTYGHYIMQGTAYSLYGGYSLDLYDQNGTLLMNLLRGDISALSPLATEDNPITMSTGGDLSCEFDIDLSELGCTSCYIAILPYAPASGGAQYFRMWLDKPMLQYGDVKTEYQPYVEHLAKAIKGSTELQGGLVMTNVLLLKDKNGKVQSGMSGLEDGIGFFAGGTYEQAVAHLNAAISGTLDQLTKMLPVIIARNGGYGRIGCFNIVNEKTVEVESGSNKITINTDNGISVSVNNNDKIVIVPYEVEMSQASSQTIQSNPYIIVLTTTSNESSTGDVIDLMTRARIVAPSRIEATFTLNESGMQSCDIVGFLRLCNRDTGEKIRIGVATESVVSSQTATLVFTPTSNGIISGGHLYFEMQFAGNDASKVTPINITLPTGNVIEFKSLASEPLVQIGTNGIIISQSQSNFIKILNGNNNYIDIQVGGLSDGTGITTNGQVYQEAGTGILRVHP